MEVNLLSDKTTGKNIIWANNECCNDKEITAEDTADIKPRHLKTSQDKKIRVREKAEIFTPAWICNEQNNLIDEAWFGRENVFNKIVDAKNHTWQPTTEKIFFDDGKSWQNYVEANRLEIACGEASYLVSRYDTVSGEEIPLENRIGLLDRKFRVVFENTFSESEWLDWAKKAVQSCYGYEFQGDNLFLARKNIFESYVEYYQKNFNENPNQNLLEEIAEIISWNLWQMDGLTNMIPYAKIQKNLFDEKSEDGKAFCQIMDWKKNQAVSFEKILKGSWR